jgi:hypothetical protein
MLRVKSGDDATTAVVANPDKREATTAELLSCEINFSFSKDALHMPACTTLFHFIVVFATFVMAAVGMSSFFIFFRSTTSFSHSTASRYYSKFFSNSNSSTEGDQISAYSSSMSSTFLGRSGKKYIIHQRVNLMMRRIQFEEPHRKVLHNNKINRVPFHHLKFLCITKSTSS